MEISVKTSEHHISIIVEPKKITFETVNQFTQSECIILALEQYKNEIDLLIKEVKK